MNKIGNEKHGVWKKKKQVLLTQRWTHDFSGPWELNYDVSVNNPNYSSKHAFFYIPLKKKIIILLY